LDPLSLSRAIVHKSEEIWQLTPRSAKVVALLLKYGADPNEKNQEMGDTSVWNNLLQFMGEAFQQLKLPKYVAQYQKGQLSIFDIVRLLLEADADPRPAFL
jgi:ankyrin repeat protein